RVPARRDSHAERGNETSRHAPRAILRAFHADLFNLIFLARRRNSPASGRRTRSVPATFTSPPGPFPRWTIAGVFLRDRSGHGPRDPALAPPIRPPRPRLFQPAALLLQVPATRAEAREPTRASSSGIPRFPRAIQRSWPTRRRLARRGEPASP